MSASIPQSDPTPRPVFRSPATFVRSMGVSLGFHGVLFMALVLLAPLTWIFAGDDGGTTHQAAFLDLEGSEPQRYLEPLPEHGEVEEESDVLEEPELLDVPWARYAESFAVEERTFVDPFLDDPYGEVDVTWTLVTSDPVPAEAVPAEAEVPDAPSTRVAAPTAISTPSPIYPRRAIRLGQEGIVVCRLHVSAKGTVTRVEVLESSGFAILDEAALDTLATWRFHPLGAGDSVASSTVRHEVVFRLNDRAEEAQ